jgi:hypothetical protein
LKNGQLGHGAGINCFGLFGQLHLPWGFPNEFLGKICALENAKNPDFTGALGEIRTPDPQIRSLMLYPAELRARKRAQ